MGAHHSFAGAMPQKSNTWPLQDSRRYTTEPGMDDRYDTNETDFEEDMSDMEEYSGRRSEDSVSLHCARAMN